jgi:hypothetical protein
MVVAVSAAPPKLKLYAKSTLLDVVAFRAIMSTLWFILK